MVSKKSEGFNIIEEMKHDWLAMLLLVLQLAASIALYSKLPESVPMHWNIQGQVDGYGSRLTAAFGIPLMTAGIYFLMLLAPRIDPRRENYSKFGGAYRLLRLTFTGVFTVLYAVILLSAMGNPLPVDRIVIVAVSLMIAVIGNVMGQFRHNYFVGIKTPWTLASESVWQKTHRLAARLWLAAGLLMAVLGIAAGGKAFIPFIVLVAVIALVPIVYSYLYYRQEKE